MAHTKSAVKRMKQDVGHRASNNAAAAALKTTRKKMLDAMAGGDEKVITAALRAYQALLDKSAKRGVIKRNNAIRKKARAVAAAKRAVTAKTPAT